jgi:hypothetical protein
LWLPYLRCRAPPLGALFARTLSAIKSFVHALLNEMFWVILNPTVRQQRRQLVRWRGWQPSVDVLQVSERIDPMAIAGLGQREQLRRRFTCRLVAEEQPGLATQDRILDDLSIMPSLFSLFTKIS